MPRVHKRKARQDIWSQGIKVPSDKTKSKFRRDRSVPYKNQDGIIQDRLLVSKGDEYYQWKFKNGGEFISKSFPKRQQLTRSDFLIGLYDLEDTLEAIQANDVEDLQSARDELVENINSLKDEQEDKLSNMPDQLQSAPSGELLQERIDGLESWASELEGVDLDDYEELDEDAITEELGTCATEDEIEEFKAAHTQEWVDEKITELQSITSEL